MEAVLEKEAPDAAPMKAAISLTHLQHTLRVIEPAIPRGNSIIPVLQSVRIEQLAEGLAVEATNLNLSIRALAPETSGLTRPVVIPAERFISWVKLLDGDDVKLSATDRRATLQCKRTKAVLPILNASVWLNTQSTFRMGAEGGTAAQQSISYNQKDLARALKFAQIAISNDESRYALAGALMVADGKLARFVSTDGHCMIIYSQPCAEKFEVLLPLQLVSAYAATYAMLPTVSASEENVQLNANNSMILISIASDTPVFIACHKIEGQFPNWEAVVPHDERIEVTVNVREFLRSLERCVLLSSENTSAVRLSFGQQIEIESSDPQFGEAKETVEYADGKTPSLLGTQPLQIGVNAEYLIQLLKRLDGEVRFALPTDNTQALVLHASPAEGETLDYIVMPLRLE